MRRTTTAEALQTTQVRGTKVNTICKWLAALALLSGPMVANALSFMYEINGVGPLKGFITTDCNNCGLAPKDFTAWSMTITRTGSDPVTVTSVVPGAFVFGGGMAATPAAITFDYSSGGRTDFTGDPTSRGAFIEFAGAALFHFVDRGEVDTCFGDPLTGGDCGAFYVNAGVQTVATIVSPDALLAKLLKEVTGVGPGKSLANDMKLIQAYYAAHDVPAACAVLTGFEGEVKAQNGKKIGPTLDAQFISDAHMLQVAIGCN